jgi:hypothetical protein
MNIDITRSCATREEAIDTMIVPALIDLGLTPSDYDLDALADAALIQRAAEPWGADRLFIRPDAESVSDDEARNYVSTFTRANEDDVATVVGHFQHRSADEEDARIIRKANDDDEPAIDPVRSEIAFLRAEIAALRAEVAGGHIDGGTFVPGSETYGRHAAPVPADTPVSYQGSVHIVVDFRATLPLDKVLEGETMEDALTQFADIPMLKAAINRAPNFSGITIENIDFEMTYLGGTVVGQ